MSPTARLLRTAALILLVTPALRTAEAADPQCKPIPGSSGLFEAGRLLLLGELHGTQESPAFTESVVCNALSSGLTVIVGLELSASMRPDLDRFLKSAGTEEDREVLLRGRLWQSRYQDGRTSRAMVGLIDRVRQFRHEGLPVTIALFDDSSGGQRRERDTAKNLAGKTDKRGFRRTAK